MPLCHRTHWYPADLGTNRTPPVSYTHLVCDICTGIDEDSITDVVELDAASNNGVDNIRALREEANFVPTRCKKRVYIIDEVHMLSPSAFNALLKIMEEPPEHVVFILATTELHKLPVTILSRCQRFDFARITAEQIAGRLAVIAERDVYKRQGQPRCGAARRRGQSLLCPIIPQPRRAAQSPGRGDLQLSQQKKRSSAPLFYFWACLLYTSRCV